VTSPWTDPARPPLSAPRLRAALRRSALWDDVRVVDETDSTNADVAAAARTGSPQGLVILAEAQRAGRGRLDRAWSSPPRAGILMSLLLRPNVPATALPLLPLLAGVSIVEAVRSVGAVAATLKWPNDVLVDDRKLAGLLVERVGDSVVVGLGLNVTTRRDELPTATATSLVLEGGTSDREPLVKECLRALERRYFRFLDAAGDGRSVLPAYREVCATIGRRVAVQAATGEVVTGLATAVDDAGRLVVRDDAGENRMWSAADVVHVRGRD
jgi:BirA family biotin operon repressor/biotin-[acetyl-CoA-carboxylase] ligase